MIRLALPLLTLLLVAPALATPPNTEEEDHALYADGTLMAWPQGMEVAMASHGVCPPARLA